MIKTDPAGMNSQELSIVNTRLEIRKQAETKPGRSSTRINMHDPIGRLLPLPPIQHSAIILPNSMKCIILSPHSFNRTSIIGTSTSFATNNA